MSFFSGSGGKGLNFRFQLSFCAPARGKKRFYNGQNGCERQRTLHNFGKASKSCVFGQMLSGLSCSLAYRSEFRAGFGLVVLQEFGLVVWSRAGRGEGMDRETKDGFSPGPVLTPFLEPAGHGPSTALLPGAVGDLRWQKIWRDRFRLKTSPLLSSKCFTFILEGRKVMRQLKTVLR